MVVLFATGPLAEPNPKSVPTVGGVSLVEVNSGLQPKIVTSDGGAAAAAVEGREVPFPLLANIEVEAALVAVADEEGPPRNS